jgi:hypothetical protein
MPRLKNPKKPGPPLPTPRYQTVDEWCHDTRTCRAKAYEMMRTGELNFEYVGGRRKIPVVQPAEQAEA